MTALGEILAHRERAAQWKLVGGRRRTLACNRRPLRGRG